MLVHPGYALDLGAPRQQPLPPVRRLQQLLPDVRPPEVARAWARAGMQWQQWLGERVRQGRHSECRAQNEAKPAVSALHSSCRLGWHPSLCSGTSLCNDAGHVSKAVLKALLRQLLRRSAQQPGKAGVGCPDEARAKCAERQESMGRPVRNTFTQLSTRACAD